MAYPDKLINVSAYLLKAEATYGTAVSPAATADGHLLALSDRHQAIFNADYAYSGEVGIAPGNLGMLAQIPAVGRFATGSVPMRAKGFGDTYTATELPNVHLPLKICGMDSTLASGAYTYTPTADSVTYTSATADLFQRGEQWTLRGVVGSCDFAAPDAGIPVFSFNQSGILDTIADAAVAAPTYPTLTLQEPTSVGTVITLTGPSGTFTVDGLKSYSFTQQRELATRLDLSVADAHAGFVPAGYNPEFRVEVESSALTAPTAAGGFDPYEMRGTAETIAISCTVGSGSYNKWVFAMAQAELVDYQLNNDGPVPTTTLVFRGRNSSPIVQTDAWSFIFGA